MNKTTLGICLLAAAMLTPGGLWAVTRDIADRQRAPLTLRMSVIGQLSDGLLSDPYDEFLGRPFNLHFANIERHPNLSPWPGQQGEQARYVDFLIGNNGNTNVRNGSDTLQGTYIGQGGDRFVWGASAAYLGDDVQNADAVAANSFADGETLQGGDARFAAGYRISNRAMLGAGVSVFFGSDEFEDGSFTQGVGGSFSLQEVTQSGYEVDFGFRLFSGERTSWDGMLVAGLGDTEWNDFSEALDAAGAVTSRFVIADYEISDVYLELSGGYNRRYHDDQGEMQIRAGVRQTTHELDNTDLAYTDTLGVVAPSLTLLGQDTVTDLELFASADTLFLRGWTQIFGGARLSLMQTDGATSVDSLGLVVNEEIDDARNAIALVMGLRQPLWNEKFRLVARARAEVSDVSRETRFDTAASATDVTRTTTSYAIGIETVLNNMVFDLAWLFGGDPPPGGTGLASRQTIDLDRIVISATFGW